MILIYNDKHKNKDGVQMEKNIHNRRSLRLPEYDYSNPGGYFVTIVTQERMRLFGEIQDNILVLNDAGRMKSECWVNLQKMFSGVVIDEFVVMPNHFHGIIILTESISTHSNGQPILNASKNLGDIIGAFKSITTNKYFDGVHKNFYKAINGKLWQRNYYEHIIRGEEGLVKIRNYVFTNPILWALDEENPEK
jgi:REP element-mobilizing transposase RayT